MHVNGREVANTHGHGFYSHWKDQWNNWLFRANTNMWFSTRAWAGCGHHATHVRPSAVVRRHAATDIEQWSI